MANRHQERMVSPDCQPITEPIGNYEERTVFWKIFRPVEEMNSWLEDRSASTLHLNPIGDRFRTDISLVINGRITKDDAHRRNIACDTIARDRTKRIG